MTFASPLWLVLLAPWAGLIVYVLRGRSPVEAVPFIDLWKGGSAAPRRERRFRMPLPLILALAAVGTCVLAAAHPNVSHGGMRRHRAVTIILDRGIRMSMHEGNARRYQLAINEAASALGERFDPSSQVRLITVPGEITTTDIGHWKALAQQQKATAVDTRDMVISAVERASKSEEIVLLSDQPTPSDAAVARFSPAFHGAPLITALAYREDAGSELMITILNASAGSTANVSIPGTKFGGNTVDLAPLSQSRNYFFHIEPPRDTIKVELFNFRGDPNSVAFLARESATPRLEIRSSLDPHLSRFIAVYERLRPPVDRSKSVLLVSDPAQLTHDACGIVVPATSEPLSGTVTIVESPITENLRWPAALADLQVAVEAPKWTPLISIDGRTIVAVDDHTPCRRAWVGFVSKTFAQTPDYVILLTNIFNWVGGGAAQFTAHPVGSAAVGGVPITAPPGDVELPLWPGIYRSASGEGLRALNAPAPSLSSVDTHTNPVETTSAGLKMALLDFGPLLILLSILFALAALCVWPMRP